MKVWVVVSDVGMNGVHVHGVYTKQPDRPVVDEFVNAEHVTRDEKGHDFHWRVSGFTGYSGTEVLEFDLDGELS